MVVAERRGEEVESELNYVFACPVCLPARPCYVIISQSQSTTVFPRKPTTTTTPSHEHSPTCPHPLLRYPKRQPTHHHIGSLHAPCALRAGLSSLTQFKYRLHRADQSPHSALPLLRQKRPENLVKLIRVPTRALAKQMRDRPESVRDGFGGVGEVKTAWGGLLNTYWKNCNGEFEVAKGGRRTFLIFLLHTLQNNILAIFPE